jgi:hypothetical protein
MLLDDYRKYLVYDPNKSQYVHNEEIYFQMKNVSIEKSPTKKNNNDLKEFYRDFNISQGFEEVLTINKLLLIFVIYLIFNISVSSR